MLGFQLCSESLCLMGSADPTWQLFKLTEDPLRIPGSFLLGCSHVTDFGPLKPDGEVSTKRLVLQKEGRKVQGRPVR